MYAVRDLDTAAERWRDAYGLASTDGGHHPRWGTANRIVPLGRDYLELISVADPSIAAGTALGRALASITERGDAWFSLCLADDDIEATAARLGLEVESGSRTTPDGAELRWRSAGLEAQGRARWLPFFIAWDVPADRHPGSLGGARGREGPGIVAAEISGDPSRLRSWLGGADLPIRVVDGPGALTSVTVRRGSGDVVVR